MAHSSRTISNDITIKVYPGHISISNPGGLPLGVTKDNILHTKHRRNPNMIEILTALGLMEGEGSGYDLIYELDALEVQVTRLTLLPQPGAPAKTRVKHIWLRRCSTTYPAS